MKRFLLLLALCAMACRFGAPPEPVLAELGQEFTLMVGQAATIPAADMILTLVSVPGDPRCPYELECAVSGPVSLSITVQAGSEAPQEFALQTFTDNDGRAPDMNFEGIQSSITVGDGYVIQLESVLPYPQKHMGEVKDGEYRVAFTVTK